MVVSDLDPKNKAGAIALLVIYTSFKENPACF